MKRLPLIVLAAVSCIILIGTLTSDLFANVQTQGPVPGYTTVSSEYPLGRDCVVTVDPEGASKQVYAGDANVITGFIAPDTVRGILVSIDNQWMVLKEGKNENWIPRHKVILLRVCP
ncbi:MAG: hypothetical protein ACSHX7_14875 [Luteolibacter sp.]